MRFLTERSDIRLCGGGTIGHASGLGDKIPSCGRDPQKATQGFGSTSSLEVLVLCYKYAPRVLDTRSPITFSIRGIERTMDVSVATRSKRHVPGASPPGDIRSPDMEHFDLSGWDSLEMTSVLRRPCPYEVPFQIDWKGKLKCMPKMKA